MTGLIINKPEQMAVTQSQVLKALICGYCAAEGHCLCLLLGPFEATVSAYIHIDVGLVLQNLPGLKDTVSTLSHRTRLVLRS
jgi:hypothetical protein